VSIKVTTVPIPLDQTARVLVVRQDSQVVVATPLSELTEWVLRQSDATPSEIVVGPAVSLVDGDMRVALMPSSNNTITPASVTAVGEHIINRMLRASAEASEPIAKGQPVTINGLGQAQKSVNTGQSLATVMGLAGDSAAPGFALTISRAAVTMTDWSAVVGATNLNPGARYFLDSTPGTLTRTPPIGAGQFVTEVGHALSATSLVFSPNAPIAL
jgi:hypothetical protein